MRLKTPEKIRKLQRTFYAKAKGEPDYRFYLLYDKIYREDVLAFAYRRCKANGGVAGVDGQTFEEIEAYGRERWLGELAEELKRKSYRPSAVRRVWIGKPNGGQRPLGIPVIKDRVVQMAVVLVIEPIFEADLQPEQYGYRPKRSAQEAVRAVHGLLNRGYREVVDADLSGYFDSIPHAELIKCVARRISDRDLLRLIKMWLKAPVHEQPLEGKSKGGGRSGKREGTPQGSPISPLLANLYLRRFILGWKKLGYEKAYQGKIINYADDFVICCRSKAEEALQATRYILQKLKLKLNEQKTQIRSLPAERIDFLGYSLGTCYKPRTGKAYLGTRPSDKRIRSFCREISEVTCRKWLFRDETETVRILNRKLIGWSNYFCLGAVSKAYRAVDAHTRERLRRWLQRKHQGQTRKGNTHFPDELLYGPLGLIRLEKRTCDFPWATAD